MQKLRLVCDFNAEILLRCLENSRSSQRFNCELPPFASWHQNLAEAASEEMPCFVWIRPEAACPSFRGLMTFEELNEQQLLDEVNFFGGILKSVSQSSASPVFLANFSAPHGRGQGLSDATKGLSAALNVMNAELRRLSEDIPDLYLLNAQNWLMSGERLSRLWYAAKIPYSNAVFEAAARDIRSAFDTLAGNSKKLIVLDLDNTLWGGILGEDGSNGLNIGGHDMAGEAYSDFQRALKSLKSKGVLLALASKNDESLALATIQKHPDMVLRCEDFSAWRINWKDKAANILDLVKELNIGLEAAVFIDDQPAERDWVRQKLPEVLVPDWPEDPCEAVSALDALACFDVLHLSEEDRRRSRMMQDAKARNQSLRKEMSRGDWIASLNTNIAEEKYHDQNFRRIHQLMNKTNQMNLSTRRLSENELRTWLSKETTHLWSYRVSDRFGDSGVTGVVSLEVCGEHALLVDFILSCRVIGRGVEERLLQRALVQAKELGTRKLKATFTPTARNTACRDFLANSSMTDEGDFLFTLETELVGNTAFANALKGPEA